MASHNAQNAVFLTEKEPERIRSTVQDKLKKCSRLGGHARESRDSKVAIKQASGASLLADMNKAHRETMPALAVGQSYSPCVVSLQDLQQMKLADLRINTHHRGSQLTVKRASPVVTLAASSWSMVQDEAGDEIERLEMHLHTSRYGKDILESGSIFVIKEPFFTLTDQNEATLRIDHPSDLIVYSDTIFDGDQTLTKEINGHTGDAEVAEKVARMLKDKGNAALKQHDLPQAHALYTEGLRIATLDAVLNVNTDLRRDIARNRAHVNLLLNRLDEAMDDAKAALTSRQDQRSKELDSKAYFRAACAAYKLGEYQKAKSLFEEQMKPTPGDRDAAIMLRKIEMRFHEQQTGTYDLKKIKAGLSRAHPRVDAASFISNTMVGDSPGRGRGLFVTRDIPAGEVIMYEKAFCVAWGHENEASTAVTYDVRDDRIRVSPVGLSRSTVETLLGNASKIKRVMDLYSDYQGADKSTSMTSDGPVVDTFRVYDIICRNAFGPGGQYGEEVASHADAGLWIRAAYINHSCIANAKKEYIGDLMVLRATRPLTTGEEIFHSYIESRNYDTRREALMTTWGFECSCALCAADKAEDPAVRKKREELQRAADNFIERENWGNTKKLTITRARRLAQAIDDTYDRDRYKDVPRAATQRIREWLAQASHRR
jgi:tetratricopeptide (TPR) repeat protein